MALSLLIWSGLSTSLATKEEQPFDRLAAWGWVSPSGTKGSACLSHH